MKVTKDMLLAGLAVSLLITVVSAMFSVIVYMSLGSPLDRDGDGCVSRVLVEENDRYVSVCPDDTVLGRVTAFTTPKAAVLSVLFLALYVHKRSKDAALRLRESQNS